MFSMTEDSFMHVALKCQTEEAVKQECLLMWLACSGTQLPPYPPAYHYCYYWCYWYWGVRMPTTMQLSACWWS